MDEISKARVVVVGGGVTGCAVIYHLAKAGWTDVVLIERSELTSGSSWHAAGSLFSLTSPSSAVVLQKYTRDLYPIIEQEADQSVGYHQCGGLAVARSEDELIKLRILQSSCQRNGIPSEFISPEEAGRRVPILNTEGLLAALYEPEKGYVDPASATNAFARAARKFGARILRHTPVTATRQLASGEWEVDTPQGAIRCEYIVNAAGLWAREVAAQAGIRLPLVPVEHHYLVTEDIPEVQAMNRDLPTVSDGEGNWYSRQEGKGILLGAYEDNCIHWAEDGTPSDFGHELLPDDLSRMEKNLADAVERLPCLGTAGIKRVINGPMIFSPDLSPLVGPYPGKRGYFCAAGVMTGFNQGGGVGRVVAEWIMEGEPSLDVFAWDVARFGAWADKRYTRARTKWFYEHRTNRIYPHQQLQAGRPLGKFPSYDLLKAKGAVFGEGFGFETPLWFARSGEKAQDQYSYYRQNWFDAVGEEARAVRENVGLFDISTYAKLSVAGPGAAAWLDRLLANKLPDLNRTVLSPMLSPKGKVIGDFTVSRLADDDFLILGSGSMQIYHMRWFEYNLPDDNSVVLKNLSSTWCGLHLAGPKAREVLRNITSEDVGNDAFTFLSARRMSLSGCPEAIVVRVSYTGELGYEIWMPMDCQLQVLEAVLQGGQATGLRLAGSRALMSLRLEKSFASWGLELGPDYMPWDTSLGRFVKLEKGDFIGRQAAEAARQAGGHLTFATFVVDSADADVSGGEAIYKNNMVVGYVTSGGFGHCVNKSIALGYLNPGVSDADADYEIEVIGDRRPASMVSGPMLDAAGSRMRS